MRIFLRLTYIFVVLVSLGLPVQVLAQSLQPNNSTTPITQNPQQQPSQNLGAPTTSLQSNQGPQVLGAYLNQVVSNPLSVTTPESPKLLVKPTSSNLALPDEQLPDTSPKLNNRVIVMVAGLTLFLGGLAVYFASKRKPI